MLEVGSRIPVVQQTSQEVLPGVSLIWGSSFFSPYAVRTGSYSLTVAVLNREDSEEAVEITRLRLIAVTPRSPVMEPRTNGESYGLPITIKPGDSHSFEIDGRYELVPSREGGRADLHFLASGQGVKSGERFQMEVKVHFVERGASKRPVGVVR
jgi:hypothetical protein